MAGAYEPVKLAVIAGSGLWAITERILGERRPWAPPRAAGWPPPGAGGLAAPSAGAPPPAPGHRMEVVEGTLGGVPALGFAGRLHYYQGYSMAELSRQVLDAQAWGATALLITNAAGSLRAELASGDVALIRDHINLMPENPLRGTSEFLDLSAAYDVDLRRSAAGVAAAKGLRLPEVVYAGVAGPTFETPAEVRMLRMLGADVAGMSTIPEVIMARRLGMRVLALSVVTNRAGAPSSAEDVLLAARSRADDVADLLEGVAASLT